MAEIRITSVIRDIIKAIEETRKDDFPLESLEVNT